MQTADSTAFARTLTRATLPPELANDDGLARHFLRFHERMMCRMPRLSSWLMGRKYPGGGAYFNARTRHFDAITRQALADGLDQLVVLGAGFDTRGIRFASELGDATVYEVDLAYALDLKRDVLSKVAEDEFEHIRHVPVDFEADDLYGELASHG